MAGRIPQQFIDELLNRLDIVDVIDARVPLKKAGKNYQARCPFHDEKSPSFSVNQDKQFYYCFGCGAGGNAIGFVMEYERLEFPQAVEKLAEGIGLEIPREAQASGPSVKQNEIIKKLEASSQYFEAQLWEHAAAGEARNYLKSRGLDKATVKRFNLGFAPPGWDNLIKHLGASEDQRSLLLDAGLVIKREDKSGEYDRFRHRIMFPIKDNRGRTVAFGGRVLTDEKPKYLNSPETQVFHKSNELYGLYEARKAAQSLERVLVVEGYMDVVMLAQFGINNAVGTLGTSLTPNHLQRLFRYTAQVVFCFDGDEAGRRAAARALDLVLPALEDGRQARFLFLPEGDDPDSLVQLIGADAFERLVQNAQPVSEFLFDHFGAGVDLGSLDGKARLGKMVMPAIKRVPGNVLRELLQGELAKRIGMEPSRLTHISADRPADDDVPPWIEEDDQRSYDAPPEYQATAPLKRPRKPNIVHTGKQLPNAVRTALRILVHRPQLALGIPSLEGIATLGDAHAPLLQQLAWRIQDHPDISIGALLGYWYDTEEGELLSRLAAEEELVSGDVETELTELVEYLLRRVAELDSHHSQRALEQIPFADMTAEQKRQYLEHLSARKTIN